MPRETIRRKDFLKTAGAGAGAMALAGCGAGESATLSATAASRPDVRWRLTGSFPPTLDVLYGAGERLSARVAELTDGHFDIRVYAAGELVPALQVMDAVQQGTVHCGISPGYYYTGKHPALAFDAAVPFGFNARQQIAWLQHAGGLDLINSVYADFGLITFPVSCTGGQMGGWFLEPVGSLADLTGLRMRIPGIGGEIMSRLGVTVQVLGAAEIYPALERGAIDATEWVGPHDDERLGFQQVAKNYYYPGWWEPGVTMSLLIQREAYDELPASYQSALQVACRESISVTTAMYDALNPSALQRLIRDDGVTVHAFSEDIMAAAMSQSMAYLEEQAADNAEFKMVYDSWKSFRDTVFPYASGNELAYANFTFPQVGG